MEGQFVVYVLQGSKKRYIGITSDLQKRLSEHNNGTSTWTKGKGPWKLLWNSESLDHRAALRLEKTLKRQKGGVGFHAMIKSARS